MSIVVTQQTEQTPTPTARPGRGPSESALRVAAATLRQASSAEVEATTVVCDVGDSERQIFEALVIEIATELGLAAEIRYRGSASSVRFTRVANVPAPRARQRGLRSMLARLIAA